jgi:hypothetical protein
MFLLKRLLQVEHKNSKICNTYPVVLDKKHTDTYSISHSYSPMLYIYLHNNTNCKVLWFQFHINCVYIFICSCVQQWVAFWPKHRAEYKRINFCVLTGIVITPNYWNSNAYIENSKYRTHPMFMYSCSYPTVQISISSWLRFCQYCNWMYMIF